MQRRREVNAKGAKGTKDAERLTQRRRESRDAEAQRS